MSNGLTIRKNVKLSYYIKPYQDLFCFDLIEPQVVYVHICMYIHVNSKKKRVPTCTIEFT